MFRKDRLERILSAMKEDKLSQLLITDSQSIYYITGINIHNGNRFYGLYINENGKCCLINNALFPLHNPEIDVVWYNDTESAVKKLSGVVDTSKSIGVDKFMSAHFLIEMMNLKIASAYINGSPYVDYVRMVKDAEEIEKMQAASTLNDKAMGMLIPKVKIGMTELECIDELTKIYAELGGEGFSFDPIIGFGANAANPHHSSNDTKLKEGESVILDIGCVKNGYCSDMTRTIFSSEPDAESKKVFNIVKEANEKAIAAVKPGMKFSEIDGVARGHIEAAGYGKSFTHRTGHCIGQSVHEFGDVSAIHHATLKEGMIFSIEPGIYLTGKVGVRIEDLVVVTADGCKSLNSYSKEIFIKK